MGQHGTTYVGEAARLGVEGNFRGCLYTPKDRLHSWEQGRSFYGMVCVVRGRLFLFAVAVAAHELVDATCGVDELLLTGEEGV